jgi:hypothetical protein
MPRPAGGILFYDMGVHQPREFEHVNFLFPIKDRLKRGIGLNELFVLKVIILDVFPKLFGELGPGDRTSTNNLRKSIIRLDRLHECAFCFAFVRHS